MRVAVSLPSLNAAAVERRQIEAAIGALAERAEVELFAESSRLRDDDLPAESAWHYLRLPERHAARPFDAALHPIGRDFRPYEPSLLLARRFPGLVWLLDTTAHHAVVGALSGYGRWDRYWELMDAARDDGPAVAAVVAAGWGTRALFRTTDPLPGLLARDNGLVAATADIAGLLEPRPEVLPLPVTPEVLSPRSRPAGTVRRLAVVSPNLSWPGPELAALRDLLRSRPDVEVRYHLVLAFAPVIQATAARLGVGDGIEWVIEDGVDRRAEVADWADVVVATTGDPTLNDRGLVQRALAGGQVAVVVRGPVWESLPAGAAAIVEPGRQREPALRATLEALIDDPELAEGIAALGRNASHGPAPDAVAAELLAALRAHGRPPELRLTAPAALARAAAAMTDHARPHNAGAAVRARVDAAVAAALGRPAAGSA